MLAEAYETPGALQRLRVHVPDRPGVLAGITQALGAERINIEDFELQHMSRERGGTLTLLVGGEKRDAERARGDPRGAGLPRRHVARPRRMSQSSPPERSSGTSRCRATSRSPIAPC